MDAKEKDANPHAWRSNNRKRLARNEDGQALIEFILFFPFLLMMYSVTLSVANSINASINQQKQTRAYFYYKLQNNSLAPARGASIDKFSIYGMDVNLWGTSLVGGKPLAACYKFNVPLGSAEEDSCENTYSNQTTQFIRVGTAYGICGATYVNNNGHFARLPNNSATPGAVVGASACAVQ